MQETQSDERTLAESSTADNVNGEFENPTQTAEAGEANMEFVRTHYTPRGVVFVYFEGDPAAEVERHFNRSLSTDLCYLPTVDGRPENAQLQGNIVVPMSERNLPSSFWDPAKSFQTSQQLGVGNTGHIQHNHELPLYNNRCHSNSYPDNSQQNAPNFARRRTLPVTYTELPAGAVKAVNPVSAPPCGPLPPAAHGQYNTPQTPVRFNPCYNALLVEPDVKPQLPAIPGEPRKRPQEGKDPGQSRYFGESSMTNGKP